LFSFLTINGKCMKEFVNLRKIVILFIYRKEKWRDKGLECDCNMGKMGN
jgi:hypothetical protein